MAELFNFQSGELQDVPDDKVAAALSTGSFGFRKGERVPVISPSGTPGTVSGEEMAQALEGGFRLEGNEARVERKGQAEYGSPIQSAVAGGLGFARARTFGISDAVLRGMGVEPETLKGLDEFNPVSSTIGELAGIATGFGSGVGGLGIRAAAGLGKTAETGLATALGGFTAESRLAKAALEMAPKGLGAAVESVPYAIGQLITEDALGDPDLTAEHILHTVGMNALLGGGIGAVFAAPGALGRAARKSVASEALAGDVVGSVAPGLADDAINAGQATGKMVDGLWTQITGSEPAKNLGNAFLKTSAVLTGTDEQLLREFLAPGAASAAKRARAVAGPEVTENATRRLADLSDATESISKDLQEEAVGGAKIAQIEKQVIRGNEGQVGNAALAVLADLKETSAMMAESPMAYGALAKQKEVKKLLGEYEKIITQGIHDNDNAAVFTGLDQLKRKMGPAAQFGKAMYGDISVADREAAKHFESMYDKLRTNLESTSLYGKMGESQAGVNKAWERYLAFSGMFKNAFQTRVNAAAGRPVYGADKGKILSFLDNLTSVRNDQNFALMKNYRQAQQDLSEAITTHYDLPPEQREKLLRAIENSNHFSAALTDIQKTVVAQNQLKALEDSGRRASQFISGIGGGLGFAVGGIPGAAIGGLLGAAANPGQLVRQLALLRNMGVDAHAKISTAVDGFFAAKKTRLAQTAKKEASATHTKSVINPLGVTLFGDHKRRDRQKAYEVDFQRLSTIATNPAYVTEQMAASIPQLSQAAPKISAALTMKTINAATYLLSTAPKPPTYIQPNTLMAKGWEPSKAELTGWERSKKAVADPMSVIRGLGNGVVTQEGIAAIRQVYPGLFAQLQSEVAMKAAEQPDAIPHNKRVMMSLAFGAPIDPAMEPSLLSAIQADYGAAQKQETAASGGKIRMPGVDKMSLSKNNMTGTERLAMGE